MFDKKFQNAIDPMQYPARKARAREILLCVTGKMFWRGLDFANCADLSIREIAQRIQARIKCGDCKHWSPSTRECGVGGATGKKQAGDYCSESSRDV